MLIKAGNSNPAERLLIVYSYSVPEKLSVDQLIENLYWLAVNLIEPIRAQFPGFTLNGGYDYPGAVPGSKRAGKSRHFYGSAMELRQQASDFFGELTHVDYHVVIKRRDEEKVKNVINDWAKEFENKSFYKNQKSQNSNTPSIARIDIPN